MPHNHNNHHRGGAMLNHVDDKVNSFEDDEEEDVICHQRREARWSTRCKLHIALTLFLLVATAALAILLLMSNKKRQHCEEEESRLGTSRKGPPGVCQTESCIHVASQLLTNLDRSVDPCDDFYQHACGGWMKRHVIPDDKTYVDVLSLIEDDNDGILKELLSETQEGKTAEDSSDAMAKLNVLYSSCSNLTAVEETDASPLLRLLRQLGSAPVMDLGWKRDKWNVIEALVGIHALYPPSIYGPASVPLCEVVVTTRPDDSSKHMLQVRSPGLGMWFRSLYENRTYHSIAVRSAYLSAMVTMTTIISIDNVAVDDIMREVMELETRLALATASQAATGPGEEPVQMTINDLTTATNNTLDWLQYFTKAMQPTGLKMDGNEIIIVRDLKYIKKMADIVADTPKTILANYFLWVVTRDHAGYLSEKFASAQFKFTSLLSGVTKPMPRWKRCIEICRDYMGMALSSKFVQKTFTGGSKTKVESMLGEIKTVFGETLKTVEWMDDKTKEKAKQKVDLMVGNIGYPSYILDPIKLSNEYSEVNMMPNLYFENILTLRRNGKLRNMRKLRHAVDRAEWPLPPTVVNAFYDRARNKMVFFAGILQPPLFDSTGPASQNYGGVGTVMGHELLHGFDDKGRLYDSKGDKKDWWTQESNANFQDKATCMASQYSRYSLYGHQLNGNLTLGENIADNGGVRIAFKAYNRWLSMNDQDTKLPGVNYTSDQAFFLNFAQIWCSLERPENVAVNMRMAPHAPGVFRVNGTLTNMNEFSEAFNCRPGRPMNPITKCQVW